MRRRFENINTVAGGKIPVFACSISAPTTAWRNPVPIVWPGIIVVTIFSCNKNPLPLPFLLCSYHN